MHELFEEMQRRYREGALPWDQPLPPPEVIDLAARLRPGRALDLGCGMGRASIFLAQRGWQCDGVDFVPQAIAVARERAQVAGAGERVRFHGAPVTDLHFLAPFYDLALDVGCLHAQRGDDLLAYAAEVARLLRPGARYLLFARLLSEMDADVGSPRGLAESQIRALFDAAFTLDRVEHGVSGPPGSTWPSAWFWMTRRG